MKLEFKCPDIEEGGMFPVRNTGRGADLSPEIVIENLSPQAKTLAVTLEDLSHPIREFTHWVIWNIPAAGKIGGGIPPGRRVTSLGNAVQGIAYGWHRYAGPKPPRGKRHIYRLSVSALDAELCLGQNAGKRAFLREAEGHILQKGSLTATGE